MKIWPAKINRLCLALKLAPRELFPQSSVQNMPAIWLKASAFFFFFFCERTNSISFRPSNKEAGKTAAKR